MLDSLLSPSIATAIPGSPVLYTPSLTHYMRRKTVTVAVGDVPMGSDYPIRVQSMTTVDTMDTRGSVEQSIRMIEAGCEYIRITAPSVKEAQNLATIRDELRARGYTTPLVADIHFTPNAAELAARIVEKVRINPGNYADRKRFEYIDYSDSAYTAELERIRAKFLPLVRICKEYGTAMRIGTNHGSLSDRILSRYGDTPVGMVESALEFLRICEDEHYYNIVLSMKSSNPQVMVQAYRLLVQRLDKEGLKPYPLHLGVTEAGEAEDGRIKSALGIGTLLEDGIGDTVRVSLTEEPEREAPVASALIARYTKRAEESQPIPAVATYPIDPFRYTRRTTHEVANFGGQNVPRVIADYSHVAVVDHDVLPPIGHFYLPVPDKWRMNDLGADYIYTGSQPAQFMLPNGLKEILDYPAWQSVASQTDALPLLTAAEYSAARTTSGLLHTRLNFVQISLSDLSDAFIDAVRPDKTVVLVIMTHNAHAMPELRRLFVALMDKQLTTPVVVRRSYPTVIPEDLPLYAATDVGGLLIDGLGDGIMLSGKDVVSGPDTDELKRLNSLAFGILQAARTRITKTEYISCPSCGRTLFDLQETTARIRQRTDHLKGVKIGIMGCIVNGPGEMADADYGYVGIGRDKIALYRGQEVIKKSVPADRAVDELIDLIREDSRWIEPSMENG
ncbi:(E)-4-hydroxy-3-methylbut-2-enyl-diphosphate synthase [Spirosoma utsteinense]|uniref:4-hydroxy-3-methylbut-2-en-1-yl diphosphate synthase (flavodoxin) n=1 Tax=Spirosoma utsteinense TaxID=2585773 RepID=A0ABR6WBP2_9BACT|nr:(E)-4-hydroxy-3-methylbut-2-enyl-diphosphate synthase [Spirosoma utsteinense]MBC3788067.1 (E)-4-hydroxy-3-methylbut-2-enyl-diphosphate synthase [Spirosoma utsteinense]MBC3793952.1 (E)-4-hydroxy-3-methylbut-2-enyl-diphosphate synthase [Spirosoma utsteinense]